jgi:hypothetical protein
MQFIKGIVNIFKNVLQKNPSKNLFNEKVRILWFSPLLSLAHLIVIATKFKFRVYIGIY